jgi:hypothetical protein
MEKRSNAVITMLALALFSEGRDKVFVGLSLDALAPTHKHLKGMLIVVGLGMREGEIREFTRQVSASHAIQTVSLISYFKNICTDPELGTRDV